LGRGARYWAVAPLAIEMDEDRELRQPVSRVSLSHGSKSALRAWEDCRCSSTASAGVSV
jgi:hypothetical protein